MIKSTPILPIRIYDDLYDQHRFNIHSSHTEQFNLVYPTNGLPSFQFQRNKKLQPVDFLYIRNVCSDIESNFYKYIPEPANNFSSYAANEFYGAFPKTMGWIHDEGGPLQTGVIGEVAIINPCGGIKNTINPSIYEYPTTANASYPFAEYVIPIAINFRVKYKIIVNKFKRSILSNFAIKIYSGGQFGTLIGSITSAGNFIFEFHTGLNNDITVVFDGFQANDEFEISYNQAWAANPMEVSLYATDVQLDQTTVRISTLKNGKDVLTYCFDFNTYSITPGVYYYVLVSGNDVYFSETFKIVPLSEIESYYKLSWRNNCDINDAILYSLTSLGCAFVNVLYLEASLFKPEPETKEDGAEDGNGQLNVSFSSWKKNINLEISKCPEYLTDTLSGIFMHDSILIRKPANVNQEVLNADIKVIKAVPEVSQILQDYYQKVNLKLLLEDLYVKTECCNQANVISCTPCQYIASDDFTERYNLVANTPAEVGDGLWDTTINELVELNPDDLICFNGTYLTMVKVNDLWNINYVAPTAFPQGTNGPTLYLFDGYGIPQTFMVLEYQLNSGPWIPQPFIYAQVNSLGYFSAQFETSGLGTITDLKVRFRNKTLSCNYAVTGPIDII